MKKTYSTPVQRIVELDTTGLVAESLMIYSMEDGEITDANDILTKEVSCKSLWDTEW